MANNDNNKVVTEIGEEAVLPPFSDAGEESANLSELSDNGPKMEEEDSGITMLDVLEEEDQLEENAYAVLGGSDDQNCTYNKGSVKRQALYACRTCIPGTIAENKTDLAGVCLACSYNCHEGHDLVELYTKRNFRCDCGNSKFPKQKCTLQTEKSPVNESNHYNHNFRGLYCICNRPYPDSEDEVADDMIQCIICEDWYHGRHLGADVPSEQEYAEMICQQCNNAHPFLRAYLNVDKSVQIGKDEKVKICKLSNWSKPDGSFKGATFWSQEWRDRLCTCEKCLAMYAAGNVTFLTDTEDTVQAYEEHGKAAREARGTQYERGMKALSSLGHVQQIEALHEYNTLTSELKDYLKKFAENKKVVREEDIREFFGQMEARKKQRGESSSIPSFCR